MIPGAVGGTEVYLRSLLSALARIDPLNEYRVYTNSSTDSGLTPRSERFAAVPCGVSGHCRTARILYEQTILPVRLLVDGVHVLLNPGFTAPFASPCPSVTVFHDLQHWHFPQFFPLLHRLALRFFLWMSALRSRIVVAVSAETHRDLCKWNHRIRERVITIPLGVDREFFAKTPPAPSRSSSKFFLTAASHAPHKNLDGLLKGYTLARSRGLRTHLVILGAQGRSTSALNTLIRDLKLPSCVRLTGWIPREQLYLFYRHARGFISASIFEGFGIPVLEALAAGLPLACSALPVFDEIAGSTGFRFDPNSTEEICQAFLRLESDDDLRRLSVVDGPARARQFTWERTALTTIETLTRAIRPSF